MERQEETLVFVEARQLKNKTQICNSEGDEPLEQNTMRSAGYLSGRYAFAKYKLLDSIQE